MNIAPVAAPDESAEDRALFDPAACAGLPDNLQAEAALVREAFDLCGRGESHAALDRLGAIGRKSPYADWRLFVRGLVAFQRGDLTAARETWLRLEPGRRPIRIATVLGRAWPQDAASPTTQAAAAFQPDDMTGVQAVAVGLMGRASMWTAARDVVAIQHRDDERTLSASQAALAIRLTKHYRTLDPDFVAKFSAACRALALRQPDEEPLLALCRGTAGPPDDPRNTRLQLIHLLRFMDAGEEVRQCAREYVERDLPGLTNLPGPLRAALASVTLERAANHILDQSDIEHCGELTRHDHQVCERLLHEAIERFPRNQRAHEALLGLLAQRTEGDFDSDAGRALIRAKLAFVGLFPEQYSHVVDLIDRFIAEGDFPRAEPLVKSLMDQRTGDTASRSAAWRFHVLKASALAASDDSLAEARAALDASLAAWPHWMSRAWIPFLEAAMLLREGNETAFTAAVEAARRGSPDDVTSDVMLHEAFVRLECPVARIEPVRRRILHAAEDVAIDSSIVPLGNVACFCMELERCGLAVGGDDHPACAVGRALCQRLGHQGTWSRETIVGRTNGPPVDDPGFWAAFRWLATHDFFGVVNPKRMPKGIAQLADNQPRAAAEVLEWMTRTTPESLTSRKSAKRLALVEKFIIAEKNPAISQRLGAIVTAARKAIEVFEATTRQERLHGSSFDFPVPDSFHVAPELPPFLQLVLDRGGPGALAEMIPLLMGPRNRQTAQRIARLATRLGISKRRMIDLLGK